MTAKEVFKIAELSNNPQGAIRYLYGKKEPTVGEIKALTGENINEMTNEELRTTVRKATRVAKQRLSNLEGKYSPAKAILEGETLPTEKQIKEMSQSELRHIL